VALLLRHLNWVTITDPHVIETSGSDRPPILKPTDRADAAVEGTVFAISAAELAAADDYEVDDYVRVAVPLRSGGRAWVYVFGGEAEITTGRAGTGGCMARPAERPPGHRR
jgi:hypothetical protein